jgi:hypothetical protein
MNWYWSYIGQHPTVTTEIIEANLHHEWDWYYISQNPNLTWEFVDAHPDKPWDWVMLSLNPMKPYKIRVEEKKRSLERCNSIKEELMASAWHPKRVERWLEAGVLDAMM